MMALASSGLPVTFSTSTESVCRLTGVSLALISAGDCVVTARQSGNDKFQSAPEVSQTIKLKKAPQSITFNVPGSVLLSQGSQSITATSSSGLLVSFMSNTGGVCTIMGRVVSLLAVGICSITASQSGNQVYEPAVHVSLSLNVASNQIAFSKQVDLGWDIFVMNPDGSGQTNVTNYAKRFSNSYSQLPVWSPDYRRIAFVSNRNGSSGTSEIYVMNADGSNVVQLTRPGEIPYVGQNTSPSWSPDGSKILFARSGLLYVMYADGSGKTQLTQGQTSSPAWSPDGSKIAYTRTVLGKSYIYVMNADGSNATKLTNDNTVEGVPYDAKSAAWFPNGEKIAFSATSVENSGCCVVPNMDIYVMNKDGTGVNRLTTDLKDDSSPALSPDGSKIAFVSKRYGFSEIMSMDADGRNQVRLTNYNLDDLMPAWRTR